MECRRGRWMRHWGGAESGGEAKIEMSLGWNSTLREEVERGGASGKSELKAASREGA
jgi:hypothetical protein